MESQRKRQSEDSAPESIEPKKISMETVKIEEKVEEPTPKSLDLDEFPILTSMISAPKIPRKIGNGSGDNTSVPSYLTVYNAFCQFLNGYLAAGGDAHLANTLAGYAAALPVPVPKPVKAIMPPIPKTENAEKSVIEQPETPKMMEVGVENGTKASESTEDVVVSDSEGSTSPKPETAAEKAEKEVTSEIQRLREAAFGRYRNVLCVICNEWICSRNRKNHIEAHLNYRPYKCSACDYSRRREIFVLQHIKTHHQGQNEAKMITNVDLNVALEVDRLADECVERTRKLIENMQEKKDGDFGEGHQFDEKALELMMAEEQEKKVVVIESVSEVRVKVANYHRRQRTKVLKKIYDTDAAKKTELKIAKEDDGIAKYGMRMEKGFEIKLEDLVEMVQKEEEKKSKEVKMEQQE